MNTSPTKILPGEQWPTEKPIPWLLLMTADTFKSGYPGIKILLYRLVFSNRGWVYTGMAFDNSTPGQIVTVAEGFWSMEGKWLGDVLKLDIVSQVTNHPDVESPKVQPNRCKQLPEMLCKDQWPRDSPIACLQTLPQTIPTKLKGIDARLDSMVYSDQGWVYYGRVFHQFMNRFEAIGCFWSLEGKWLGGHWCCSSALDELGLDFGVDINKDTTKPSTTVKSSVKFVPVSNGVPVFNESTTELHQAISDPVERQHVIDYRTFEMAWLGKRGPDQERIAKVGLAWISLLLRKNADYGNSAWSTPALAPECTPDTAIRVRMSDKIARIQYLLSGNSPEVAESLRDNVEDLGSYCLLLLTIPRDGDPTVKETPP